MNEITFTALRLLTMILMAVLSAYVIPWVKARIGNERLEQISQWAALAVSWAEQIVDKTGAGTDKKIMVESFLKDLLATKGIALTEQQIDILIESAVRQMHTNENDVIEMPVDNPIGCHYEHDADDDPELKDKIKAASEELT